MEGIETTTFPFESKQASLSQEGRINIIKYSDISVPNSIIVAIIIYRPTNIPTILTCRSHYREVMRDAGAQESILLKHHKQTS